MKIVKKIKENKAILIGALIVVASVFAYQFVNPSLDKTSRYPMTEYAMPGDYRMVSDYEASFDTTTKNELEVRQGSMEIKSKNAENDFNLIKESIEKNNGYIEDKRKNESDSYITVSLTSRIPVDKFDELSQEIQDSFDVRNYWAQDYRLNVQYQVDEITIIKKALDNYNQLRQNALSFRTDKDQIMILADLTEKELNLVSRQKMFQRDLAEMQKLAEMATLTITIEEKVPVKIWPEEIGLRFRENLQQAAESITLILTSVVFNAFVLIVKILEYLIYLAIIAFILITIKSWLEKKNFIK